MSSQSGSSTEMILAIVVSITGTTTLFGIIVMCYFLCRPNKSDLPSVGVGGSKQVYSVSEQQQNLSSQLESHSKKRPYRSSPNQKQIKLQKLMNEQRQSVLRPAVTQSFTLPTIAADSSSTAAGTSSSSEKKKHCSTANNNSSNNKKKKGIPATSDVPIDTMSSSTPCYEDDDDDDMDEEDYFHASGAPANMIYHSNLMRNKKSKKKTRNTNSPQIRRFSSSSSSISNDVVDDDDDEDDGYDDNSDSSGDDDIRTANHNHFDDNWSYAMTEEGSQLVISELVSVKSSSPQAPLRGNGATTQMSTPSPQSLVSSPSSSTIMKNKVPWTTTKGSSLSTLKSARTGRGSSSRFPPISSPSSQHNNSLRGIVDKSGRMLYEV